MYMHAVYMTHTYVFTLCTGSVMYEVRESSLFCAVYHLMPAMDRHAKNQEGGVTKTSALVGLHAGARGAQPRYQLHESGTGMRGADS